MTNDEELPYRSPAGRTTIERDRPSRKDEVNFNTLKRVQTVLSEAIDLLHKDFNAFTLLDSGSVKDASDNLLLQVKANKIAYDILRPVLDAVDSTVEGVNRKYRQK